jgi:hypothetical protein
MYFCILHSKLYEMLALRDLAKEIVASGAIMPVIEPNAVDKTLERALDAFVSATMDFCLIVNPENGKLTGMSIADAKSQIFEAYLEEYDNVFPTYNVSRSTTEADIEDFCDTFADSRVFYFLSEPPKAVVAAILAADPEYVLFLRGAVMPATKGQFTSAISADVREAFRAAPRNADYPDNEFFSDAHVVIPNADYEHFGDYSITGRTIEAGRAPYCVAIHYPYLNAGQADSLYIKHYKSDTNDTQTNPGGKYAEALAKLIADIQVLGHRNRTATTLEYESDNAVHHNPGLAMLKRRGITQHIRLLISHL